MTVKVKHRFYDDNRIFDKIWKNEFGKYHREDGPAVECSGTRAWYKNGKYHREDGPAVIWADGTYSYYLNGKEYAKKEYWEEIEREID